MATLWTVMEILGCLYNCLMETTPMGVAFPPPPSHFHLLEIMMPVSLIHPQIHMGNILIIKRSKRLGKSLMFLPGGAIGPRMR